MSPFLKYFHALVWMCLSNLTLAQNEVSKWYLGNYAALDFSTNPPTSLANGAMATWEGCSSIAGPAGNLLFYTNGVKVWNQSHLVMANGAGLYGDNSSSQSALIVKQPGSSTIYFVFTTDGFGLSYSVVDMSLAAGMGSVTIKNVPVNSSSTERLCGARHCNSTDVWIISHDNGSNEFLANLVTATGVNTTAIVSPVGSNLYGTNTIGCMKVSPNGKKLGTALFASNAFELFDFDAATGVVSNSLSLPVSSPAYGCEFSPDGTKFYGTLWASTSVINRLYQWDLCSGSNPAIVASGTSFNATHTGQLQLAPDGKIYQARAIHKNLKLTPELSIEVMTGESMLGVIHNPNASAFLVNFNNTGQTVSPALSMFGLPNFVSGFYKTPVAQFTYNTNPSASCVKAFFTAPPLVNATCSATSYTVSNVKWLFGDPASGPANSSVLLNPDHSYPSIGTYQVRLILYNACGGVIDTLKQEVMIGSALANNTADFSICAGQSLTLTAADAAPSYSWSTGASGNSVVVTPSTNTTYSLGYTDVFGCQHESVHTITVNSIPTLTVSSKDTICEGGAVALKASGAILYSWSTGSTNSTITVVPPVTGSYSVTGTSIHGCSATKVIPIVVKPSPVPAIAGNTIVCFSSPVTVVAQGTGTFSWNNGVQGPSLTVYPDDNMYIFSVKAAYPNGCVRYKTVRFNIVYWPQVSIAGTSTACAGETLTLTASGASTYTWNKGSMTGNPIYVTPLTHTVYSVIGTDTNNCRNWATDTITIMPATNATVSDSATICEGEGIQLSATGGSQYAWEPAAGINDPGASTVVASPSVSTLYSVTVSDNNICASTRTVMVSVNPKPALFAGNDTTFSLLDQKYIRATGTGSISWIAGGQTECPGCASTRIFPETRTCYTAKAVSMQGCSATDEVCIDVDTRSEVFVPTAFTPNGDGLNDEFFATGPGISDLRLNVYNRWGEELFASGAEKKGWNGSYKGRVCQEGVYNWILKYVSLDGQPHQKTGCVILLR
jgi:gliding motility-associated-like protein